MSEQSIKTVGVILAERIYAALIVDHALSGSILSYPSSAAPADADDDDALVELPSEAIIQGMCEIITKVAKGHEKDLTAVGVAIPALVRSGIVGEAPNLPQLKGTHLCDQLETCLRQYGITAKVNVINDADAVAAGLASKHGRLDDFLRVWTIGTGIGYGMYPFTDGVWEGGHCIVSLDDKETFCGCGGRGHLEGIMGHRAMRLRFLDMEPEEVFEAANRRENPDPRCVEFKRLWHKALAAATATSIHFRGSGRFFITGYNVRFLDLGMFKDYLHQMVKMSPLQNYSIEIVPDDQLTRIIGSAVAAEQAAGK
jgi:glucokinase